MPTDGTKKNLLDSLPVLARGLFSINFNWKWNEFLKFCLADSFFCLASIAAFAFDWNDFIYSFKMDFHMPVGKIVNLFFVKKKHFNKIVFMNKLKTEIKIEKCSSTISSWIEIS